MGRSAGRALLFRLALAAVGLCLGLGILELGLRTVGIAPVRERRGLHVLRPDRDWLYGMRPGASGRIEETGDVRYRVNADGFRDRVYARPKPAGVFRIVVLGDSLAFGWAVSEAQTFPKRLEASLAQRAPALRVEVVNLGVSGYNAYTEARLLEDVGVRYQPDLVLVQFCINDLNDPTLHFDVQTRLHMGAIPDAAYPDPSLRRAPLLPPSRLLRACRRSALCARLDELWLAQSAVKPDEGARRAAVRPADGRPGPEWRWLEARYREMAETARRAGSRFAVLAFPHPGQLGVRDVRPVRDRLVEMGHRNGWLTVDLLPAFRAGRRLGSPLFIDWWHPTPVGHRLAAAATLSALACGGLLPPGAQFLCLGGPDAAATGQ